MWRFAGLVHHTAVGGQLHITELYYMQNGVGMKKRHILGDLDERHSDVGCISAAELSQLVTDSETSL